MPIAPRGPAPTRWAGRRYPPAESDGRRLEHAGFGQAGDRSSTMRDVGLGLLGRFTEGDAEIDRQEHRVVAEPVAAPRLVGERAKAFAPSRHRLRLRTE